MAVTEKPPKPSNPTPRIWLPLPWAIWFWSQTRKIIVFVIGTTVLALGIVMLVTPGPGWATIFGGLVILASEFAWARWMLKTAKRRFGELVQLASQRFHSVTNSVTNTTEPSSDQSPPPHE